jgi:hypothetical protein
MRQFFGTAESNKNPTYPMFGVSYRTSHTFKDLPSLVTAVITISSTNSSTVINMTIKFDNRVING